MARIRTIKPDFFTSLNVARLSFLGRLTFIGLWTYCDDEGRGVAQPELVKAALFPLDADVDAAAIGDVLIDLDGLELIQLYDAGRKPLLQVCGWAEHQRISHPSKSTLAPPPERLVNVPEDLANVPETLRPERKGKERKGKEVIQSPSVLQSAPGEDRSEEAHRFAAVIDRIVTQGINGKKLSNPTAYRDRCERNARRDHGPTILRLLERFLTALLESIVGHVLGEPSNLGMYA